MSPSFLRTVLSRALIRFDGVQQVRGAHQPGSIGRNTWDVDCLGESTLQRLRGSRTVDFQRGLLHVKDWKKLAEIAQFNSGYLHQKKAQI
jgi:hypothetical protein